VFIVERQHTVENGNLTSAFSKTQRGRFFAHLVIAQGFFTFSVKLKETLELGFLVPT
jgi:hypothetical protein